jgi:predicted lipoprotein with Yx(FWY)xxD motif
MNRTRTRTRTRTLALAVSVAASLALAACGSSGSSGNASAGYGATATTTAANTTNARAVGPASTQPAGSPGMSSGSAAEIEVVHDAKLGDLLATSDGHTLYRFEQDHGTSSACSGPCLDAWPPVTSDAPQAGKGVTGKLTSVDGAAAHQVAIDGHLLYTYAGDQAPGAVNGTSIPDWYAVAPDGSTIEH